MNKEDYVSSGFHLIDTPKHEWKLTIGDGFNMLFYEGQQPNRFYRWMQKIFLGLKWEKIDE